jgi:hypothetical protein
MKALLSSATIAALAIAMPLSANAQDAANGPIVVTEAIVQPAVNGTDLNVPGMIAVEFHNTRSVPATKVTFELDASGAPVRTIDDVGTFSQGATIHHDFPNAAIARNQTVSVAAVTFADGSVWRNDGATPQPLRQAVSQLDLR